MISGAEIFTKILSFSVENGAIPIFFLDKVKKI